MLQNSHKGLYPASSIIQLIENQAFHHPSSPAVTFMDSVLTYKELNEKSNQLAHYLKTTGIQPQTLIGISLKRSLEMVVAVLGVLKAGGVYIPIDPEYPSERIRFMLMDSNVPIILTEQTSLKKLPVLDIKTICLDLDWQKIKLQPEKNPLLAIDSNHLAYVLYTSGSTGVPKGVMVTHGSLISAYQGWEIVYEYGSHDSHLQMANFSFDVFSGDLARTLCSGGKLVLCPSNILLKPAKLYELMVKERINCAEFVPTVLRRLLKHLEITGHSLQFMRLLICGSDNWSMNEYKKLQQHCGSKTRVINSYGLTEATIDSTYFETPLETQNEYSTDQAVPIGKPFPNTEIYLLDEKLNQVPTGEVGEIYIGGSSLARGYLNQPNLTTEKFIKHPFNKDKEARVYKTGDRGRCLPDGNIEFLGRIDNQIKLRGMRIELSDIENVLNCHKTIRESLVMPYEDGYNHKRLVAYIVTDQEITPTIRELRKFLQTRLPIYMIPSTFIRLESLPVTPNGKIDRQALKSTTTLLLKAGATTKIINPD